MNLPSRKPQQDYLSASRNARVLSARDFSHEVAPELEVCGNFYEILLGQISEVVLMTNLAGDFLFICSNIKRALGYTAQEIKGLGNISALFGEDLFDLEDLRRNLELNNIEREVTDQAGNRRIFLISIKYVAIHEQEILFQCHDVTLQKQAETALQESYQELERRVDARTRSLAQELEKRQQIEQELQQRESQLRAQYKGFPIPTYTWQKQGENLILIDYNYAAETFTKGGIQSLVGKSTAEIHEDSPEVSNSLWECFHDRKTLHQEMYYSLRTTREAKYLEVTYVFVPPNLVMAHTKDITECKIAEAERDGIQVVLERFFSLSLDLFCIANFEGYFQRINPVWEQLLGYSQEELLTQPFIEFVHPDDRALTLQTLEQHQKGICVTDFENRYRTQDGGYRWLSWSSVPIPSERMIYGVARDITEQKQIEAALRESEKRYRRIIDTAEEGIWMIDQESRTSYVNAKMAQMLGYEVEEMQGKPVFDFMDEKGKEITQRNVQRRREGIQESHDFKFLRKDGSPLWTLVSTNPIFGEKGEYLGAFAMCTDITARKQAEITLSQLWQRDHVLMKMQEEIRQSLNLDQILTTTVTEVRNFLKTDRVLICRFQPDWSSVVVVESVGEREMSLQGRRFQEAWFSEETCIHLYLQGRIQAIANIHEADLEPYYRDFLEQLQIQAKLVVPLLQEERLWGLLVAHHCQDVREWEMIEIDLLQQLAGQVAIAIQQSEIYQQLQSANEKLNQLALVDGLTGIANRRRFDEYIRSEWRRLQRESLPLSLIMGDIDYFKLYNDTYGHPAGDKCLQDVAGVLMQQVQRPADLVARYGGEEFAVILPNTDLEGALEVAQRIHNGVNALQIPHASSRVADIVTISLGIASQIPNEENSPKKLIKSADQALYQVKQEGRNGISY